MNCKAKIQDSLGNEFVCLKEATKSITIETFAPHLNKVVKKVRHLCDKHGSALLKRHRYQIKHLGKKSQLTITPIEL